MARNLRRAIAIVPPVCLIAFALAIQTTPFAPRALAANGSPEPGNPGGNTAAMPSNHNLRVKSAARASQAAILLRSIDANNTGYRAARFDPVGVPAPDSHLFSPANRPADANTVFLPMVVTQPASSIRVSEGWVTLNAYPYETFLRDAIDPTYNIVYKRFDANAYYQSPRTSTPKSLKTVILANEYLELTFLPELGGRLWQVLFKPTGQQVLYNNAVLKPSPWGPAQQGGWLAAGGMEWDLPVDEHGYEWGVPWSYAVAADAAQATITFRDSQANDRVRGQVSVTLPSDAAYFTVHPRIENPTGAAMPVQFWVNAMLGLDSRNVSPTTEFVLPSANVLVHSTGDAFIPAANVPPDGAQSPAAPLAWPVVAGRDLSRYANWSDYLGVFASAPARDFAGAYNHANEFGVARVSARSVVSGTKLFAFGLNFGGRSLFADDGSDYAELWSGLPRTFFRNDDVTLAAGEAREWDEEWIPFAQTGGLSAATRDAVLYLNIDTNGAATIGAAVTRPNTHGDVVLYQNGVEAARWSVSLSPGNPMRTQISVGSGNFGLRFIAPDGMLIAATP